LRLRPYRPGVPWARTVVLICHWRDIRVLINGAISRTLRTQCLRVDDAFGTEPCLCVELGVIYEDCQRTDQERDFIRGKKTNSRPVSRRRTGSRTLHVKESGHSGCEASESRVQGRQRRILKSWSREHKLRDARHGFCWISIWSSLDALRWLW
jgi:hypothetical protein